MPVECVDLYIICLEKCKTNNINTITNNKTIFQNFECKFYTKLFNTICKNPPKQFPNCI